MVAGSPQDLTVGQWVDVLPYVDVRKDAVSGQWWREGDDILTEPVLSRLMLPVFVDGAYEIEAEFTRNGGRNDVA